MLFLSTKRYKAEMFSLKYYVQYLPDVGFQFSVRFSSPCQFQHFSFLSKCVILAITFLRQGIISAIIFFQQKCHPSHCNLCHVNLAHLYLMDTGCQSNHEIKFQRCVCLLLPPRSLSKIKSHFYVQF